MTGPRIGELFAGYGGLGLGVKAALGGQVVWVSDIDKGACKILAHRFPDVPNLGDVSAVDWSTVPPVDILTGGFPCQDVSSAGKRAGLMRGTRSGLWHMFAEAIDQLRPSLVVIENVRGLLSARGDTSEEYEAAERKADRLESAARHLAELRARADKRGDTARVQHLTTLRVRVMGQHRRAMAALRRAERRIIRAVGTVLGTLADLGYDAVWHGLRAADVGAPHGRWRVFIVATPAGHAASLGRIGREAQQPGSLHVVAGGGEGSLLPSPRTSDTNGAGQHGDGGMDLRTAVSLLPTPAVNDMGEGKTVEAWDAWTDAMKAKHGNGNGHGASLAILGVVVQQQEWGQYAAAIHRWEQVTRPAPPPIETGPKGNPRLSAAFSEWLMGLPAGWITDVPGVTRNEALKLAGNGVVPQQAAAALRFLLGVAEVAA